MPHSMRTRRCLRSASVLASVVAGGALAVAPAQALVAATHPTKTNVVCNPNVAAGHTVICGVSVTDVGRNPTPPTGTVALRTNVGANRGTLNPTTCTLVPVPGSTRTSRCSFTYTPRFMQPTRIYGNYSGDATHAPSHGHTNINFTPVVGPPPPPPPPPPPVVDPDDEGLSCLGDVREDNAELAAAARAGNRVLEEQIQADILSDRPACFQ